MIRSKLPESIEVLRRNVRLPDGTKVSIFVDLSPEALARFAKVAVENKTKLANYAGGTFIAVVMP